jgi:FkbH-like protein
MSDGRMFLVGRASWELFAPVLTKALLGYGLHQEVVVCGFDRELRLWSGADADFEANPPRVVVVFPEARDLFERHLTVDRPEIAPEEVGNQAAEFLLRAISSLSVRHPGVSWIVATAELAFPGAVAGVNDSEMDPLALATDVFNAALRRRCRDTAGWSLFERGRVTHALGAAATYDARMDLLARMPLSSRGMKALAEHLASHWNAVLGRTKKVLALDCDNTLWGGIVGEDGVGGVRLGGDGIGRAYTEFQRTIARLESRGVLVTLCSRNNPKDVMEVFETRPEMLLRQDRICASHIGWGAKSDGLGALAKSLGVGLDTFVFVDDNPAERDEVRAALPEVTVPEFPSDPAGLPAFGEELAWRYFYKVNVTVEDRGKTELYRSKAQALEASREFESPEDFLKSLRMEALFSVNDPSLVARSAQLSQKTNQFNLTLRRYTEAEIAGFLKDPGCVLIAAALKDRFTDHGWIGLAIFKRDEAGHRWDLDSFMMSCRVIGRSFEGVFLSSCIDRLRETDPAPIRATFVPGPRNSVASGFLEESGFRLLDEGPDGIRRFELSGDVNRARAGLFSVTWKTAR